MITNWSQLNPSEQNSLRAAGIVVDNSGNLFYPNGQQIQYDYSGTGGSLKSSPFAGAANAGTTGTTSNTGTTSTTSGTGSLPSSYTQSSASSNGNVMPVPGQANPNDPNQINVADYAGNIVGNPSSFFTGDNPATATNESMMLSDRVPTMTGTEAGTNINGSSSTYQVNPSQYNQQASHVDNTSTVQSVDPRNTATYNPATTYDQVTQQPNQMQAAQGQLSQGSIIDPNQVQIDVQAAANGTGDMGNALNDYAYQDMTNVVDTSTPEGKAMANQLGRFGYIDSKATTEGQLALLQSQFFDADGNPKIPAWASGTARNVSKIMSFSGMTGTAAAQAMSQALMEASLPIAQQDAQFFQGLTITNLNNKQQQTINKAQTLANFETANLSARENAAVQNSQHFLQMDLQNLSNDQQAAVINNQNKVQSILTDANAKNTERLFEAQSQNDLNKYYDNMNTQINEYNAGQLNAMKQYNASNEQAMAQFNGQLENQRQQFYQTMQYNIDLANAKWRQTVTTTNNTNQFQAAATDVKNMVDISNEQLNQIWDRSDSMLQDLWQSSENEADRNNRIVLAKLQAQTQMALADKQAQQASSAGWGAILGTVAGDAAQSFFKDFNWGF